jgi:hypothetical protein
MTMYGGRDAATGAAVRPPDLAVVRQVDHDLVSVMLRIVTLTSPSSPVCGCAGRPQPGRAGWRWPLYAAHRPEMAARERTASPEHNDQICAGILFAGKRVYGVGTPSCWRRHQTRICVRRGDNHANNIVQKERTLLTEETRTHAHFRIDPGEWDGTARRASSSPRPRCPKS